MSKPIELYEGDQCPECHQDFLRIQPPSDAQLALASRRDDPVPLPPTVDRMSADDRAEHGNLYRCMLCGMETRLKARPEPAAAAKGPSGL